MQNFFLHMVCSIAYAWCTVLLFSSVLNACLYRVDNKQFVDPEGGASEDHEQQVDEGKCHLTY
jgi:hypothetical protein